MLQQDEEGDWRPVSWWSRAIAPAEKEYSTTELECKALHDILLYYDMYSQGVCFDEFTDHNALVNIYGEGTDGIKQRATHEIPNKYSTLQLSAAVQEGGNALGSVSRLMRFGETPIYSIG